MRIGKVVAMTGIKPSDVWEVYSDSEGQWMRAVVMKVEDGEVLLHHEGVLDFLRIPITDLEKNPNLYREAARSPPAC